MANRSAASGSRSFARDYPPLLVVGAGLLIVLAVLPSSLNLPQTNPTETLEYAPVPPDDAENPPPAGNLSSLGLGTSAGIDDAAPVAPPTPRIIVRSSSPTSKRCVGSPPRQTEDPLSPPCVAFFEGDNFGATYAGVRRDEVRVLFYLEGGVTRPTSRGSETTPVGTCSDLGDPPQESDDMYLRALRPLQRYFNSRYQTYGRVVRFIVCFSANGITSSPEHRRADAAANFERSKPFAFVNVTISNIAAYDEYLLDEKRALSFDSALAQPAAVFRKFPGRVWSYIASIEQQARKFSSYVCTKVVGHSVSFGGNDNDLDERLHNGRPRRLGLLRTDDPAYPQTQLFARLVREQVSRCGGLFVSERTYPRPFGINYAPDRATYGQDNMIAFKQAGVSTVIWAQGWEEKHTRAAAQLNYRPEWVMAGDLGIEGYDIGQFQDPTVWSHAWVAGDVTFFEGFEQSFCFLAIREADPDFPRADATAACPLRLYESLRQLFTGIQVAGPRLSPTTMDEGYHAIPHIASTDPRIPACFYEVGDYTCVKDTVAMWWDSQAQAPNNTRGCWRMPERAKRYLPGTWPREDVPARRRPTDPCNGYSATQLGY